MKGLILAGGSGTRLRPLTYTKAKQLVPVANKPIMFYGLEGMADAGILEVGIVVGDTAEEVMAACGDGSRWGLSITYLRQDAPRGLAHGVLIAQEFLGDEDFVLYLGDNMLRQRLADFVDAFEADRVATRAPSLDEPERQPAAAQILLKQVPDPERFGVAALDDAGRVTQLLEKPAVPPSDLALVGIYLFDARIHEAVRSIQPSKRGELEITDAIQWLIDQGHRVRSEILQGWWIDTGKLTPLLEANRLVLETIETRIDGDVDGESSIEGRVIIEAGAVVVRSTVRGPAVVGAGTRVIDSFIGPFSAISDNCEIISSEIDHSVVLGGSRIEGVPRLIDSLLGTEVEVIRSGTKPRATRLMLGDHSRVDLG
jgi:glucose-1-phosphate thymidylyltransferase